MAINRVVALYIVMILAFTGLLVLLSSGAHQVGITSSRDLSITDVQFEKDYLTVTVANKGSRDRIIGEVKIDQISTLYRFLVHEPVSVGEEISIGIDFKWTSGDRYLIILETADTVDETPAAAFGAVAP